MSIELSYLSLLEDVLKNGVSKIDRTGVGTLSVFGRQMRHDLSESFPAITTKKLAWKAVKGEALWFLEGSRDERRLAEITHGTRDGPVTIWTPNALAPYWKPKAEFDGDLGRVYGVQWRHWRTFDPSKSTEGSPGYSYIDQVQQLIDGFKNDPDSRRHILTAWNPGELNLMALPPCHCFSQFWIANNKLSCQVYIRSNDLFLGAPFNIASYALITHIFARICNLDVGDLVYTIGDAHVYKNHIDQVKQQLERTPYDLPTLVIDKYAKDLSTMNVESFFLMNYQHHPAIKAEMAV
jgi:thymidylate synthase